MYHEHPFTIIRHGLKNIWLLIFPVLRGIRSLSLDFETFYTWLRGAWFDILIILAILAFGFFRWLFTWYRFDRHHIRLMTGIFIKTEKAVPYSSITAVTAEHTFYLRPFKAVKLQISTRAGIFGSNGIKLTVNRDHIKTFYKHIPELRMKEKKSFEFRPKWYAMIIYSLIFSSSLSGVIYLATVVFHAGRIATETVRDVPDVYRLANDVSENMSEKMPIHMDIPPWVIIILFILAGTWLFSFVSNLLRYSGFVIKKDNSMLRIISGAVTKRVYHIVPDKINYVDLRQNFLMKLFGLVSLTINCSGYGTTRYEHPVVLPILTKDQANRILELMGFEKYIREREIKPEKMAAWSYISIPTFFLAAIPLTAYILARNIPRIEHIMFIGVIIAEIPIVWMIIVKIGAFLTTGITMEDNYCCIHYSRFYAFHTILADKNKLVKIEGFQDIIDERIDRCRLDLYFSSQSTRCHKVKGLNIEDVRSIVDRFDG